MNLFTKIFILFNFVCVSTIVAQDCKAHVVITCDIENVNIYIDGVQQSSDGKSEIDLGKGIYKIVTAENSDRWDAKTFIDSLIIRACDNINIFYNFRNKVLLKSDPEDAYVFIDDSLVGYTPLLIPLDKNNIKLKKNGFEPVTLKYQEIEKDNPVKLKYIGEDDDGQFFDKTLFKILTGSMILLGATTAYYKLKADNKFDEYKKTHNKDLLDQTNKFDTISGITFAVFQINFGTLIYFFLVD